MVPLLGRFPHRHPLHGRAHRRQLQARGDAQPVPAPAPALGLDLHRLEHHLPQPRAALDLPRQAGRPGEGRHPLRRVPPPPAPAPRGRDRRHPRRADLHRQGRASIYGYDHFVCDTSGSLCEVVDPRRPRPTRCSSDLAGATLPVWIRGTEAHLDELASPLRPRAEADVLPRRLPDRALERLPRRRRASPRTRSTRTTSSATASAR